MKKVDKFLDWLRSFKRGEYEIKYLGTKRDKWFFQCNRCRGISDIPYETCPCCGSTMTNAKNLHSAKW